MMNETVIASATIVPIGTVNPSLSHYVAVCCSTLKKDQGISYQLTAMGTTIQGPLEKVLELVQKMHEAPFT